MFDFVRSHSRLMLGLIVLLIIPSFVFFGIDGYKRMTDETNTAVAKIDGQKITRAEFDAAHRRAVEQMRLQAPGLDVALFDTPEAKRESLESLVRERVLMRVAVDTHAIPDAQRLEALLKGHRYFAPLRTPDGQIDRARAIQAGFGDPGNEQQIALQFALQQVLAGVAGSGVSPAALAGGALDALLQQREVQVERFDAAAYRGKLAPTEAELEAWHKAHADEFRAPEQATIEWVVLEPAALAKDITVTEAGLQQYYEQNASRYTVAEERRARHILVKAEKEMPAAERQKAKAKAEALLAQVRAKPADFAAIAKVNSDDPGSAQQGGDLDFFGRGAMVKPFEDAAFSMKPGEISPVIETDFGYHVIQLTEVRGGQKRPFAEVRAEIEAEVRRAEAQKKYAEAAEQFSNLVYEQPDSLQPVIDRFKLEKRSATVQRRPAPGATGALASARLLEAVFKDDALRNKKNTDAIEVGTSQLAAARVVGHQPERTLPLAEVRDRVRERVLAEQAAALAKKDGEARLAAVKADAAAVLPLQATVSRVRTENLPRPLVEAALKADPEKLPLVQGVDLGAQGYAVLRVAKVLPRDPAAGGGEALLRQQFDQALASAEAQAYYEALKKRYKVSVNPPAAAASAP